MPQTNGKCCPFYFVLEAKMGLFGNRFLTDLFFALFWMKSILSDVTPYNFSLWNSLYLHKPMDLKCHKTDVMEKCLNKSVSNLRFHFCKQVCFQQYSFTIKAVQSFLRRSCLESLPLWLKYFLLNHFSLEWWLVTCHLTLFKKSSDKELWQGILYLKLQRVQEKQEQYFNKLHHLFSSSFFHVWNTREFKKRKKTNTHVKQKWKRYFCCGFSLILSLLFYARMKKRALYCLTPLGVWYNKKSLIFFLSSQSRDEEKTTTWLC